MNDRVVTEGVVVANGSASTVCTSVERHIRLGRT